MFSRKREFRRGYEAGIRFVITLLPPDENPASGETPSQAIRTYTASLRRTLEAHVK